MTIIINHPLEPAKIFNIKFMETFSYLKDYIDWLVQSDNVKNPDLLKKYEDTIRDFVSYSHAQLSQQVQKKPNATSITIKIDKDETYKSVLKSALNSISNGPKFEFAAKTYVDLIINAL